MRDRLVYAAPIDAGRGQDLSGAVALAEQSEEQMLGPDVSVVKTDGLALGKSQDSLGVVVKAIYRSSHVRTSGMTCEVTK